MSTCQLVNLSTCPPSTLHLSISPSLLSTFSCPSPKDLKTFLSSMQRLTPSGSLLVSKAISQFSWRLKVKNRVLSSISELQWLFACVCGGFCGRKVQLQYYNQTCKTRYESEQLRTTATRASRAKQQILTLQNMLSKT